MFAVTPPSNVKLTFDQQAKAGTRQMRSGDHGEVGWQK
jgi:hypothetical protein